MVNSWNDEDSNPVTRNGTTRIANEDDPPIESAVLVKATNGNSHNGDSAHTWNNKEDSIGYHDEEQCGLGRWFSPRWMQRLASKQMFLAVFCLTCVLQGMFYTYFVSVLTTIEKLFQIQSKTTGIIMSATEIGQIGGALLLTYYGGQGHRPKWIGWGMVLFAASSFICALPHFVFWRTKPSTGYSLTAEMSDLNASKELSLVCRQMDLFAQSKLALPGVDDEDDEIFQNFTMGASAEEHCSDIAEQQSNSRSTNIVLSIFFVSLLGIGMGQTAVYTLGIPYIDDNVANRESPTYFAITIGVRIFGPVLGFILGSFCTSLYVDPLSDPDVTTKDPRWIGAWWLGMLIVSAMIFCSSVAMFSFPRRLPKAPERSLNGSAVGAKVASVPADVSPSKNPRLKDFPKAVRRLLKNDILLLRTASSVLHILPIAGLYTFLPKYLESQFRLTANVANMISGIGGILVMGLGILFSGIFIRKMKPSPKFVAAWLALTALLYAIGMALLMLVGCPMDDFAGLIETENGKEIVSTCNRTCECDTRTFAPVCSSDGQTFFSACHAGCSNATQHGSEIGSVVYSDCECLDSGVTATPGYCPLECPNFVWYIGTFSLFVLIHATNEVGSMLLTLRCVDPKDKAMALGLIQFAIGLFGNVPCPIIYGAVVDSACIVWEVTCGEQGACWLYDSSVFRLFFHGTTGAIMLLAFVVDVIVWYKADKITFADEDTPSIEMEEKLPMRATVQHESTIQCDPE